MNRAYSWNGNSSSIQFAIYLFSFFFCYIVWQYCYPDMGKDWKNFLLYSMQKKKRNPMYSFFSRRRSAVDKFKQRKQRVKLQLRFLRLFYNPNSNQYLFILWKIKTKYSKLRHDNLKISFYRCTVRRSNNRKGEKRDPLVEIDPVDSSITNKIKMESACELMRPITGNRLS